MRTFLAWLAAVAIGAVSLLIVAYIADVNTVGPDQGNWKRFIVFGASLSAALLTTPVALWALARKATFRHPIVAAVGASVAAAILGATCEAVVFAMTSFMPPGN